MEVFTTVLGALNTGFLQTLKLFAVTLVGAIPLGLVVAFGSMSRWTPFRRLGIWMQRRLPPMGEGGEAPVLSCGSPDCAISPIFSSFSAR